MSNDSTVSRPIIDRNRLPEMFPTHRHPPQFWEHLGRAVASFGFLEEVLGKAIFAASATRQYPPHELDAAYKKWASQLEKALTGQLKSLADLYGKTIREHPDANAEGVSELVTAIKHAADYRNVLCHGSWRVPDANGASIPLFVNQKGEVFESPIDIAFLGKVRMCVAELSCDVMDSVTRMGWQFPGSAGPGTPIHSPPSNPSPS